MSGSFGIIPLPSVGSLPPFYLFFANPTQSGYSPITPSLLMTSQAMLGETVNSSLASVNANASNQFNTIAGLFQEWGNFQNTFASQVSGAFTTATNKSAVACNGFFSCLF